MCDFDPDAATRPMPVDLGACDSALEVAARTMTVLASVNAVEEFGRTAQGRDMAVALLKKGSGIPPPLKDKLEELARG